MSPAPSGSGLLREQSAALPPPVAAAYAEVERLQEEARLADSAVESSKAFVRTVLRQLELAVDNLQRRKAVAEAAHAAAAKQKDIAAELDEKLKALLSVTSSMQIGTDPSQGQAPVLQPPSLSNSGIANQTSSVPVPAGPSGPPSGPTSGPTSSVPVPAGPSGSPSGPTRGQTTVLQPPISSLQKRAISHRTSRHTWHEQRQQRSLRLPLHHYSYYQYYYHYHDHDHGHYNDNYQYGFIGR
ncbi:hypothetical protein DL767_007560 [Monosporascus sp. MG133]|nr:hypothetical protein DL767_007560 [Monosporascus sp. MG133]